MAPAAAPPHRRPARWPDRQGAGRLASPRPGRRLPPGPPLRPSARGRRRRAGGRAGVHRGLAAPQPRGSAPLSSRLAGRLLLLCLAAQPGAPAASPPPRLPLRPRRADSGGPQCPHRLPRPPRSRRRPAGPARVTSRGPSGPSGRACPACTALAVAEPRGPSSRGPAPRPGARTPESREKAGTEHARRGAGRGAGCGARGPGG